MASPEWKFKHKFQNRVQVDKLEWVENRVSVGMPDGFIIHLGWPRTAIWE